MLSRHHAETSLATKRLDRRLSAVLAADVAGFSRLVGVDEEGTIGQLKAHRSALFDAKLAEQLASVVVDGVGTLSWWTSR